MYLFVLFVFIQFSFCFLIMFIEIFPRRSIYFIYPQRSFLFVLTSTLILIEHCPFKSNPSMIALPWTGNLLPVGGARVTQRVLGTGMAGWDLPVT